MKSLCHLLLVVLCSQAAIAQSDSTSFYYGVYTNADQSMTYMFTDPWNESVSMEFEWTADKNSGNWENGRVGVPSKGRYPMMMNDPSTGERIFYWIDFKTTNGRKSAVISTKTDVIDTIWFSDDQSRYEEYIDYMNGASEEEEPAEETGELTIAGYQREDGTILILDFSGANGIKFSLIGAAQESCTQDHSLDGVLQQIDEENYNYKTGNCVLHFVIEDKQVTIKEENCSKSYPKGCKSWKGVYQLDM